MAKVLGFTINIRGTEAAIENATDLRLAISEINKQLKQTSDASEYKALEKELIRLKAAQKEANAQLRQSVNEQRANLDVAEDSTGAYRRLSAQLNVARNRYKDLAAAGRENTEEAQALIKEVTTLDQRLKDIDADVGQFQRNVGDYEGAIRRALPGLGQFTEGIENIRSQATRTGKVLATGFLAFEVINQLFQGARAIKEFADEFIEFRREVNRQTGLIGENLGEATARAVAIAETYNQTTEEVIRAANAVSREFDISINEALDRTAIAFREGADNSNELLDSLREYASQVDNVDALFNIIIRAAQEGIYSDKGIDAVKEFGLRIREQTTATRDALENAFGTRFTDELFGNINSGAITTTQALAQVAGGLRDTELTAQQTQQVLADVFGGPGEDAGLRFIELLADVDEELTTVSESTDGYKQQQQELFDANLEVARAQDALAEALEGSSAEFDILTSRVKTFLLNQARGLVEFFESIPAFIAGAQAALVALRANLNLGQNVFNVGRTFTDAYKAARREVQAVNEDVERQNELLREQQEEQKKLEEERKRREQARQRAARRREREGEVGSISEIETRLRKVRAEIEKTVVGSDLFNQLVSREKEIEAELVRAVEQRNRAVLEKERQAELERLGLITELGSRAISETIGTVEDRKTQVLLDKIKERNQKVSEELRRAAEEQARLEQETLRRGIEELSITVIQDGLQVLDAFGQAASENRIARLDQEIEAQEEFITRLEAQASEAGRVQRERLELQIGRERAALRRRVEEREKAQRDLARKEKTIAIIQATIQAALATLRALANPPGPPFSIPQSIAAGVQGGAQVALIAAQPLAGGGIVPVELPDSGGRIANVQNIPATRRGDKTLVAARPGEVFLNDLQQSLLGGASTFRAIGVPGFQGGGRVPSNMAPRLPSNLLERDERLLEKIEENNQLMMQSIQATNARIDRLRAVVVSEDIVDDLGEAETLRLNATLE